MNRFDGKTVLVTGASRGLGKAFAEAFAAEGAFVFVGYERRAEDAAKTVAQILEANGRAEALRFDVTRPDEVSLAVEAIWAKGRGLDVLVNNAGRARDNAFALMDAQEWRDVMAVNLDGVFHCTRAVVPGMLRAGRGAIINVSSISAQRASPGQANYAASKGGLVALTRTLAAELAPKGIRVNALVPGMIDAGITQHLDRRRAERMREAIPMGRMGRADEVAAAALFLASDAASYITGQALVVDGGLGG